MSWTAERVGKNGWEAVVQLKFDPRKGVDLDLRRFVEGKLSHMVREGTLSNAPIKPSPESPKSPASPPVAPETSAPTSPAAGFPISVMRDGKGATPTSPPPQPPRPPTPPKPPVAQPTSVSAPQTATRAEVDVLLAEIEVWPDQPRTQFKAKPLLDLAGSMSSLQQVLAILIRPFKDGEARLKPTSKYQIVDGQRRYMAAIRNRSLTIRAIIVHPKDIVEQHRMSVIANLHREQHSHYELARAVMFQYDHGRNAKEITADFSQKSVAWAYKYLALKELLPELFELLNPAVGQDKQLTFRYACILARVKKDRQVAILEQARREGGSRGPRGVLNRLQELAEENLSPVGRAGRKLVRDFDHAARTVNRAVASVSYNARTMLEMVERLKKNPKMRDPGDRAVVAAQAREAAKTLQEFAQALISVE